MSYTPTISDSAFGGGVANIEVTITDSVTGDTATRRFNVIGDSLKNAVGVWIAQVEATKAFVASLPTKGEPFDYEITPPTPVDPTPFDLFVKDVQAYRAMQKAVESGILKGDEADFVALAATIKAALSNNLDWVKAFG